MLLRFLSSVLADTLEGSFGIAILLGRSVAVMIPRDGYDHGWVSVCTCVCLCAHVCFLLWVWVCVWESVCWGWGVESQIKRRPTLHTPTFSRPSNSVWNAAAWALWSLRGWASYRSTLPLANAHLIGLCLDCTEDWPQNKWVLWRANAYSHCPPQTLLNPYMLLSKFSTTTIY